jgi:hypothetical protein
MQRVNEWKAVSVTRGEILVTLHKLMTRKLPNLYGCEVGRLASWSRPYRQGSWLSWQNYSPMRLPGWGEVFSQRP